MGILNREQGPIEILCKEIGFRFLRPMETPSTLISFTSVLLSEIEQMCSFSVSVQGLTGKQPSEKSLECIALTRKMVELPLPSITEGAKAVHDFCRAHNSEHSYPTNHLLDMLSSVASVVRFGLEKTSRSRHAAEAASHIWLHRYGIKLQDGFTSAWARVQSWAKLQEAILLLVKP